MPLDLWPTGRPQRHDREPSTAQILLVSEVAVRGDQSIERLFCGADQIAVRELRPAQLIGSRDDVSGECIPQREPAFPGQTESS